MTGAGGMAAAAAALRAQERKRRAREQKIKERIEERRRNRPRAESRMSSEDYAEYVEESYGEANEQLSMALERGISRKRSALLLLLLSVTTTLAILTPCFAPALVTSALFAIYRGSRILKTWDVPEEMEDLVRLSERQQRLVRRVGWSSIAAGLLALAIWPVVCVPWSDTPEILMAILEALREQLYALLR